MKSDPTREFCNRQALNLTRLQDNVVKALTEYPALYGINSSPHGSVTNNYSDIDKTNIIRFKIVHKSI